MTNEIAHWKETNRFLDYKQKQEKVKPFTNTDELSEQDKKYLETALNKSFVNPKFKQKYFVTESQLTPYHKLRQIMLELRAQEESIENLEWVMKTLPKKIEIEKIRISQSLDDLSKAQAELALLEHERDYAQAKRRVAQNYIERHQLLDLLNEYVDKDEYKTADGRSLLEVFDTPEEDFYEEQYWTARLGKQAAMDILSYGKIMSGNMDAISMLPEKQQNDILGIAYHYSLQMEHHQDLIKNSIETQIQIENKQEKNVDKITNQNSKNESIIKDVYNI